MWLEEEGRHFVKAHYPGETTAKAKKKWVQVWTGLAANTKLIFMTEQRVAIAKSRGNRRYEGASYKLLVT